MDSQTIETKKNKIIAKYGDWTAHNIHLGHGIYTRGELVFGDESKVRRSVQLIHDMVPVPWNQLRILDLGCNEGLYAIEFARRGASVLGIEGREANIAKAEFAKEALGLSNVTFEQSDVRQLSPSQVGLFDVVFCSGLLYHLDTPDVFHLADDIRQVCRHVAIFDTHISFSDYESKAFAKSSFWVDPDKLGTIEGRSYRGVTYWGRAIFEHGPNSTVEERLKNAWASLDNPQSFWFTRSSLVNMLINVGFTTVVEVHAPTPPSPYPPDRVTMVALPTPKQEALVAPLTQQLVSAPLREAQAIFMETSAEAKSPPASRGSISAPSAETDREIVLLRRRESVLMKKLEALKASTSWRITAPLRRLRKIIRGHREGSADVD